MILNPIGGSTVLKMTVIRLPNINDIEGQATFGDNKGRSVCRPDKPDIEKICIWD